MTRTVPAAKTAASFDSATAMQASLVAALSGRPFWHVGQGPLTAAAARVSGQLPWWLLRSIYARIGAAEGIPVRRLASVDLSAVAAWLTDRYPVRRYPAVMIGSSNGAITHLAAATQVPWLPGTTLLAVSRRYDRADLDAALAFGREVAPPLLARNPDIVLHHMHDPAQDELMVAGMAYFRLKWRSLPPAYASFLAERLAPGAPVVLIEDSSTWPVVRVGERHVFQAGAQGGLEPGDYLRRPRTPTPDDYAAEAEWGAEAGLAESVAQWCADHDHPLVRLRYDGPEAPAAAVAEVIRDWYRDRDEDHRRLLVPCFILADPWQTIETASVPYWAFFSVQPALQSFRDYLGQVEPYREAHLMLFQHGARSAGIATPEDWAEVLRPYGTKVDFLGLDRRRFPHDIAFMTRYGPELAELDRARRPWSPLPVAQAFAGLHRHGL